MGKKAKQPLGITMRKLHRDFGFFIVGIVTVYALSGIVLIYRDTDFLKKEKKIEKQLPPGTDPAELGRMLFIRDLKVEKTEGEIVYFREGTYNIATGMAVYSTKELPGILKKMSDMHKVQSEKLTHWYTILFSLLLLFMAVSSFWMFKTGTSSFRRGVYIALAGIVVTLVILFV
jgi:hypothetical protein